RRHPLVTGVQTCALPISWIRGARARKEKIMGFGHRVYKAGDVRARVLRDYARKAAERTGNTRWEQAAEIIEKVLAAEKNLHPNLDRKSVVRERVKIRGVR